jgi:defect-in-organelle-trafficking protein DotD
VGPLAPVVQVLASRAGYQFVETGKLPAQPVLVRLDATERPLIEILQDVGLQAGSRATVIPDIGQRQIEVRYAAE